MLGRRVVVVASSSMVLVLLIVCWMISGLRTLVDVRLIICSVLIGFFFGLVMMRWWYLFFIIFRKVFLIRVLVFIVVVGNEVSVLIGVCVIIVTGKQIGRAHV